VYVTSDIFDLKRIGRFRDFDWRETLVCGVAVYGSRWPGYQSPARFLIEAAKRRGLLRDMEYAGYDPIGATRTRNIKPRSFERLARGELTGARNAVAVLLEGSYPALGTENEIVLFGGVAGDATRLPTVTPSDDPGRALQASFVFPLNERPIDAAIDLFRLSVDILDAEYGYYFVRDEFCFPTAYPYGISPSLDNSAITRGFSVEIRDWSRFVRSGKLWSEPWPMLRDLYEVNLLSERHTSAPIEGLGYLTEWISSRPGRGRLKDVGRGRWLWILTDAEMFNVRPLLNEAGLLLSCLDRVYRDLPGGSANAPPRPVG
jgi:hypothetical protein